VITASVVTAILLKYPIGRIVEEMQRGNAWRMIPVALGASAILWFTATASDFVLLRPQVRGLRFVRLMRGKAAMSMLNALGMAINYGGFVLWIRRALELRWSASAGTVMMISVGDLAGVSVIAVCALLLGGDALPADVRDQMWWIAPIVAVVAWSLLFVPGPGMGVVDRRHVLVPWRDVPRRNRALSLLARCCTISVLILATWIAGRAFGLPIPLKAWASFLPVLLVVGALPVNVGGFGAVQAAWLLLFGPWANGPEILAFQFLWHLALAGSLVLRGLPFVRAAAADIARKAPAGQGPPPPAG
jgi:hypothetical protein